MDLSVVSIIIELHIIHLYNNIHIIGTYRTRHNWCSVSTWTCIRLSCINIYIFIAIVIKCVYSVCEAARAAYLQALWAHVLYNIPTLLLFTIPVFTDFGDKRRR